MLFSRLSRNLDQTRESGNGIVVSLNWQAKGKFSHHSNEVKASGSRTVYFQVLHMTEVRPRQGFVRQTAAAVNRNWSSKFHFEIPQTLLEPHPDPDADSLSPISYPGLPPSLHIQTVNLGSLEFYDQGGCHVVYTLRVRSVLDSVCVAENRREIDMVPNVKPMPPLDTKDFPGEYRLNGFKALRNRFIRKRSGRLSVTIMEPQPLQLCRGEDTMSTRIALEFQFHQSSPQSGAEPPEFSHCEVGSRLKAHTFISTHKQASAPTMQQLISFPSLMLITRRTPRQIRKLHFPPWHEVLQVDNPQGNENHIRLSAFLMPIRSDPS